MKKIILTLIVLLFLSACAPSAPSEGDIQTAIANTQAAAPTLIPFSVLQLDDLIVQSNDLPAGVSGAQIGNTEEAINDIPYSSDGDIPLLTANGETITADYYIRQDLSYQDKKRGVVKVWIYEDTSHTSMRYINRTNLLDFVCRKASGQCSDQVPVEVSSLGDDAIRIRVPNYIGPAAHTIVFYRCNAVVEIDLWTVDDNEESVITYAQRLDKRLTPIVCRKTD